MILQSVQLVNFVDIQQDFSSISNTLEKMNTSESIVGIKLLKGDTVLYQTGETIYDYDSRSDFESLMFTRDGKNFYQISGSVNTDSRPLQLVILYDISPVFIAEAARWLRRDQLSEVRWLPADLELVNMIISGE